MQNRGWSDPFPVLWFTPREKSEEKNYAGSCIAIYRRSAVPDQGRRLVRGRCFGTGTAVPPAGAAHRRNGGIYRHHSAGGHGVHHVRRVRWSMESAVQRHIWIPFVIFTRLWMRWIPSFWTAAEGMHWFSVPLQRERECQVRFLQERNLCVFWGQSIGLLRTMWQFILSTVSRKQFLFTALNLQMIRTTVL